MTQTAVVVGAGLVGASVGAALARAGWQVHLEDAVATHALVAASRGSGVVAPADPEAVDLVVVATPPEVVAEQVVDALQRFGRAVVTDVASVKGPIIEQVRSRVRADRFVPSHPMAGSALTGPLTAEANLFEDRTWVVTPLPENDAASVQLVCRAAAQCGAAVVELDPDEHDRAVAQVSHTPHLMSILTASNLRRVEATHLDLAGQGIRDVTRVAGSDPVLWRQILFANRDAVREQLRQVRADLDELLQVLDQPEALQGFLERGRRGARSLPGKHGSAQVPTVEVTIEIPDTPGALARLFTDIERAGVNVEDLTINHDPRRQVGFLAVEVGQQAAAPLAEEMRLAGWTVR